MKVLDVSHSNFLLKTPDFSGLPSLEKLILEDCRSLVKVHDSIGGLHKLSVLNLTGCRSLRKLPKRIRELKSLEVLKLSRCSELELAKGTNSFPVTFFWSWVSLRPKSASTILELLQCNLRVLDLSDCNLTEKTIPNDLSVLSTLRYLNLSKNPVSKLPESIQGLTSLLCLVLSRCTRLQSIPKLPSHLRILDARSCRSLERIANLPNFLKSLDLKLEDCRKLVEVEGLFMLKPIPDMDEMFNAWNLHDIKSEGLALEVELHNNLTSTISKGPVLGLYEFGIFSMFLPGSKLPRKFNKKSIGSSPISFSIPSDCSLEMQGLDICIVYEQCSEESCGESLYIKVSNKSKGIKWIYSPVVSVVTGPNNTVVWLSHWKFGNQIERGDEVTVSPSVKCLVREFGVEVSYNESEEKWIQHHYSSHLHHVVDGDLSVFEMNRDVYLLSLKF